MWRVKRQITKPRLAGRRIPRYEVDGFVSKKIGRVPAVRMILLRPFEQIMLPVVDVVVIVDVTRGVPNKTRRTHARLGAILSRNPMFPFAEASRVA